MVVNRSGLPLGYEVFAGNRSDFTTVEEIVVAMESKCGQADRIWVVDRGMVSAGNLWRRSCPCPIHWEFWAAPFHSEARRNPYLRLHQDVALGPEGLPFISYPIAR